jgi:hypothetical protein
MFVNLGEMRNTSETDCCYTSTGYTCDEEAVVHVLWDYDGNVSLTCMAHYILCVRKFPYVAKHQVSDNCFQEGMYFEEDACRPR